MLVSIITPLGRSKEKLQVVEKALKRQSFKDYEWLIEERQEPLAQGKYWDVYAGYNRMVKRAKGELLISWQDSTFAKSDTLEKFVYHYQQEPKTIVSAVGNKYSDDSWTVKTWQDPRERDDQGSYYYVNHPDIELNLCSLPKQAIYDVGGFDETLDYYSSLCGLDVLQRLWLQGGWKFALDQTIKSFSLEHGRLKGWDENTPFKGAWEKKCEEYQNNAKLNYL